MTTAPDRLPPGFAVRVLRLHALAQGLACGLVVGLGLFLATNWLVIKGGPVIGPHLALLSQYLPGYRVTFAGSLLGLAYGFVGGFAGGCLLGVVYNAVALRTRRAGTRA